MKVLIAEDDDGIREGLVELVGEVAEAEGVRSATEAQAALDRARFDLVLTDLRLSGSTQSGRAVVDAARRQQTPVALVTATTGADLTEAVAGLEIAAVITKPFQLEDITELVERFRPVARVGMER